MLLFIAVVFFRFCALHARLAYTLRMVTNHWKLINKNLIMFLVHIRSRAKLWFISKQTSFSEMVSAKRWKTISRRRREKTATFNMAKRAFVDRFEKSCFTFALFKLITYLRLCDGRISQALERRKKMRIYARVHCKQYAQSKIGVEVIYKHLNDASLPFFLSLQLQLT